MSYDFDDLDRAPPTRRGKDGDPRDLEVIVTSLELACLCMLPDTFSRAQLFDAAREISGLPLLDLDMERTLFGSKLVEPAPGQRGKLRVRDR